MDSATILTNLAGIPSGLVDVSDLNNFSTRRTSPWGTSRSLKLAGLSSGRDSNKRTNVRNSFKKDFFKLFSNSVLGKTMENILKTVYLKNVTDKKHYQNHSSTPTYVSSKIFNENLVAVHKIKESITLETPAFLEMCILDLSKTFMYDFH